MKFKQMSQKEKAEYISKILLYPLVMLFARLGKACRLLGTKKGRITANVLSLAMILSILSVMTFTACADSASPTTWAELQAAMAAGGSIKLMRNISCDNQSLGALNVPSGKTVTLDLNGFTIDRALKVPTENGYVILNNGTLTVTDTSAEMKGKIIGGNNSGTVINNRGGGVNNCSTFYMTGGTISGNTANYGGGVNNYGTFTMTSGTISGNTASTSGGGVYNTGTVTMTSGTISGNTASTSGGGVNNSGTFTMNGGTISGNTSSFYGGGVENLKTFTMTSGTISGNTASYNAGGVYNNDGTFTMNGGAISGNTAGGYGGGVYNYSLGTFTMTGGAISGNTASNGGGVYNNDTFNLTGNAVVTGNVKGGSISNGTLSGGTANNVYLFDGTTITVTGTLSGNAAIGMSAYSTSYPVPLASGSTSPTYTITASDVAKFASDDAALAISLDNGTVYLMKIPTSWAELQAAMAAGGSIKLMRNISCDNQSLGALNVPSGKTVTLDLNGFTIDRALKLATENGCVIQNEGTLTVTDTSAAKKGKIIGGNNSNYNNDKNIYGGGVNNCGTFYMTGGTIFGNTANNGGGVYNNANWYNGSLFTMTGGAISGNTASNGGGGVYNNFLGTFTMNGGAISGNTAKYGGGGVRNDSTFNLTGNAVVTGNVKGGSISNGTLSGGTANNVYLLDGRTITITGALSGNAAIGINTESTTYPVPLASGSTSPAYTITASDAAKFTSDDAALETVLTGSKVVLQKARGKLTADKFTFTAPADLTYDGIEKAATVTAKKGVNAGAVTVKYYQNGNAVTPINAGTYTVKIDAAGSVDYKPVTNLTNADWTFTIVSHINPQTGDNYNMLLWVALLFISGGVLVSFAVTKHRRKTSRR